MTAVPLSGVNAGDQESVTLMPKVALKAGRSTTPVGTLQGQFLSQARYKSHQQICQQPQIALLYTEISDLVQAVHQYNITHNMTYGRSGEHNAGFINRHMLYAWLHVACC